PQPQQRPVRQMNAHQLMLQHLPGGQFHTLYTKLGVPPGDPLIKRVMPFFLKQTEILELEAKTGSNSIDLAHDALLRMGQRRGATLAHLVSVLRRIPESAEVLAAMGFAADAAAAAARGINPPAPQPPQQQQQQPVGLFERLLPASRTLEVDEGGVALFGVTLGEQFAAIASVSWHKALSDEVLCTGVHLRIKQVALTDQGQYRCAVQLANQLPVSSRPYAMFSLKVRARPHLPRAVPDIKPKGPLPIDMERTHKYALIVSCQSYKHMPGLGCGNTRELDQLEDYLRKLGYRTLRLMDPSRAKLLCAIDRLRHILALLSGPEPHLFLLLDGHGTVVNNYKADGVTTSACFLPIDAKLEQPDSFLRVEEDFLKPLADCLPGNHAMSAGRRQPACDDSSDKGLLVVMMDMCRIASCPSVHLGGDLGVTVRGSQIHRLHATSYGSAAAAVLDSARHNRNRQSFGISALNSQLRQHLCDEGRLQVDSFLTGVSKSIREIAERYQEQLPELQVSATRTRLSDLVMLTDFFSIFAANRLVTVAQPAWRKFALLIGASRYECGDLPCVPGELRQVAGALQLLGYQTIVCCDWARGDSGDAKEALLAVVADFCELLREAGGSDCHPVQALLLVDGHGELSVSSQDANTIGRNLFVLPGGGSVDIDAELVRPLFEALPVHQQSGRRLLLGFYDACRTADNLTMGVAPSLPILESPDYFRLYSAGASQVALAGSSSGSFGVRALLSCLRSACSSERSEQERREELLPWRLLNAIADRVFRDTHRALPGHTQFPNVVSAPSRLSLADLAAYHIDDADERLKLLEMAWQLREKHNLN
ncbi:hypothetical protein BOX15_Mlig034005g3, partial [Macrostomum lignano]